MICRDVVASTGKFYRDKLNTSDRRRLALVEERQDEFYETDSSSSSNEESDADSVVPVQSAIAADIPVVPDQDDDGSSVEDVESKHEEGDIPRRKSERLSQKPHVNMNEDVLAGNAASWSWGFSNYAMSVVGDDPRSSHEAYSGPNADEWKAAEADEYRNLYEDYQAFEFVDPVAARRKVVLPLKIVYKTKYHADGSFNRRNVRCTIAETEANGAQLGDVNGYAATINFGLIGLLIGLAAFLKFELFFLDVESAYLLAPVTREIYCRPTQFLLDLFQQDAPKLIKLKRSVYGLVDAARNFRNFLDRCLKAIGFTQSAYDPCLYFFYSNNKLRSVLASRYLCIR